MYEHEHKWTVKIKRKKSRRIIFMAREREMRRSRVPVFGGASAISISTLQFRMFMVDAFPNGVDLHTIENEFMAYSPVVQCSMTDLVRRVDCIVWTVVYAVAVC